MTRRVRVACLLLVAPVMTASAFAQTFSRGWISVNGGYQATTNDFSDGAEFTEHQERGRVDTDYTVKSGPAFDISAGAAVWRNLAVGVGVTRFSGSTPSALSASVPHPFFFNRPRTVTGEIAGLKRKELAVHVQARGLFAVSDKLEVMLFGGPSFFRVTQGVVTDFDFAESYPYDEASFAGSVTTEVKRSKMGANVGGDVGFFFTRQVGVGFTVQYSGATMEIPSAASGTTAEVKVGGLQTGGGLRFRF